MDKFAVDIEKVLDEFEYNEGREDSVTPVVIKNNSLSRISQKQIRPPAASYRRPAFEPINLADADFAAAPISAVPNYTSVIKQHVIEKDIKNFDSSSDHSNDLLSSIPKQVEIKTLKISPIENESDKLENDISIKKDLTKTENIHSEDTPDLLDSKTLNPIQPNSDCEDENDVGKQLPDITSVISALPSDESSESQPVFDLIKPHVPVPCTVEDLPPIVDVHQLTKEDIPDLQVKPISFESVGNVSEAEVEDYLNALEIEESVKTDDDLRTIEDSFVEPDTDSKPCLEEPEEQTYSSDSNTSINEMGLTGSSNKNEKLMKNSQDIGQKQEPEEPVSPAQEFSKNNSEKTSLLQEFPPENGFNNKKCELDNINSRSCTNHSKSSKLTEFNLNGDRPSVSAVGNSSNQLTTSEVKCPSDCASSLTEDQDKSSVLSEKVEITETSKESDTEKEEISVTNNDSNVESVSELSANTVNTDSLSCGGSDSLLESSESDDKPTRPSSLCLGVALAADSEESPTPTNTLGNAVNNPMERLGKFPPFWVPDTETDNCMQCHNKFTVIKRRHHCRACGLVLCSKCCNLKAPLEYMEFMEARVCQPCFNIIYRVSLEDDRYNLGRQPNPNNPMEYCSTIPPLQQAASSMNQPPPSVLVPTGVLKREGKSKSDVPKQVMFSDGIRPGGDLTELDGPSETRIVPRKGSRRLATPPGGKASTKIVRRTLDPNTLSFIPSESGLPPVASIENGEFTFHEDVTEVAGQPVKFAINYNLFVIVKKVNLDCCVHRECWSACSEGLACVGQDEVAIVLECYPDENLPPVDIFHLVNTLHLEASKGTTAGEMSFTPSFSNELLGSKDHGGFIYIRPTFQCTTNLLLPSQPYLIAILVHRWETPWARLFPLRLVLRLGAEYRYYPCPLVSIRNRPPLYTDIGHTVMKILVDFRKYSYSLATVRGLLIHMEDRQTTILFPRNRYDQVVRALNNSNDSVLAFGANLSLVADSHLVCIQGTKDENTYHTQAINIHNKPRRVTGASFVVFNGALKTAGLSGKSSIMEDGLMVQLPSDSMVALRYALREMQDYRISCGPNDEETVVLQWTSDDVNFNIGVKSCIDGRPLDGVPSIRVHNGTDYPGNNKLIRWTEVFILQTEEGSRATDPIDISRVSELLARATCIALVPELDSLAKANLTTIGIRANIHPDNVSYEAGSLCERLPSTYMKHLDEELVPVVHQAAVSSQDTPAVLELVFRIMNHP